MKEHSLARLKDKVALVSGGVSGIGLASAVALAEAGATVVVSDVQDLLADQALTEIRAAGGEAQYRNHDVTEEETWEKIVDEIVETYGHLDIVVNNAGIGGAGGRIDEVSLESWRQVLAINLDGVFLGVKHAIRAMRQEGNAGSIINISSVLGLVGLPNTAAYAASKGGVRLLTKAVALECADRGDPIRVNSVHPGFIDTPLVASAIQRGGQVTKRAIEALQPTGQMGRPRNIADAVVFLASDESAFMTGSEMVVDGGYTAR